MSKIVLIPQKIFKTDTPGFSLLTCNETDLELSLPTLKATICDGVVGLAPVYNSNFSLKSLAIGSATTVLIVTMSSKTKLARKSSKAKQPQVNTPRNLLRNFLCDPDVSKVAFQMDKLASALFLDYSIRIVGGKDLLSCSNAERHSIETLMNALGGEITLRKQDVIQLFVREESANTKPETTALQAWSACYAAKIPHVRQKLEKMPSINTQEIEGYILTIIAKSVRNVACLIALKPSRVKNEIQHKGIHKDGALKVVSQRYKTRVMRTAGHQTVEIKACKADGSEIVIKARVQETNGREAKVSLKRDLGNARLQSMETIGRSLPTLAEALKTSVLLRALQKQVSFYDHPFIKTMWGCKGSISWRKTEKLPKPPTLYYPVRNLNSSQEKAVETILSNEEKTRVALIHGPPGTGKTTVIAAAVTSVMSSSDNKSTLWLVAQSNVAVKNIAEKLASVNFLDFKILVSKDFHFDWHEHLYTKIEPNLIRSDDFAESYIPAERQLKGSRVILCTLSMLSNDKISVYDSCVPLQTVIFDEASQIELGDYFPMLIRYRSTLRKLVFIGDNKQLAPYGASEISSLGSIFEESHLTGRGIFLDTQYRMPTPIGSFISARVYKNKLKSKHLITDSGSCRFVDVSNGIEESKGRSWQNIREADVAIKVAGQLFSASKSFRIITPYDPQRSLLENKLKDAKLPWEDKCFNIDAFQGNEDDYIVISLVRSEKLGFLREDRRVNVMLTRCKKGMIVCTSRHFIKGTAAKSLVGQLATSLGSTTWVEDDDVLNDSIRLFI